jgi:hypothetical protein
MGPIEQGSEGMSAGGAAAARAAQLRAQEEEESMTSYTEDAVSEDYEYKILRSATGAFLKHEAVQQACLEEAQAGWQLLEKFDECRLRFKRPISARGGDHLLSSDPYRTYFGVSPGWLVTRVILIFMGMGLLSILLMLLFLK